MAQFGQEELAMMTLASVKMPKCSLNCCSHEKYFDLGISKSKLLSANYDGNRHVFLHVVVLAAMVCGRNFAKRFLLDRLLSVILCVCLEAHSCGQFSLALAVSPPLGRIRCKAGSSFVLRWRTCDQLPSFSDCRSLPSAVPTGNKKYKL